MTVSTDTSGGWMPGPFRVSVPETNFQRGQAGRRGAVLHIAEGSFKGTVDWFQNAASGVSSHFVVARDGRIAQCVSVFDTAYANGLSWSSSQQCWVDPQKHLLKAPNPTPAWPLLTPPTNPNLQTITIEQEGHSGDSQTSAQQHAIATILRYIAGLFPSLAPWHHGTTLIGHCDISPVSKPHCPGVGCRYDLLTDLANGYARYVVVAPCAVVQSRSGDAPLASGPDEGQTRLSPGDVINVGDVTDGWLWVSDSPTTPPGIGFLLGSYARPV